MPAQPRQRSSARQPTLGEAKRRSSRTSSRAARPPSLAPTSWLTHSAAKGSLRASEPRQSRSTSRGTTRLHWPSPPRSIRKIRRRSGHPSSTGLDGPGSGCAIESSCSTPGRMPPPTRHCEPSWVDHSPKRVSPGLLRFRHRTEPEPGASWGSSGGTSQSSARRSRPSRGPRAPVVPCPQTCAEWPSPSPTECQQSGHRAVRSPCG